MSGDGAPSLLAQWQAQGRPALHAALVDLRLRGALTGLQALAELRSALGPALPTLVITGDTAPERLQLLANARATERRLWRNSQRLGASALNKLDAQALSSATLDSVTVVALQAGCVGCNTAVPGTSQRSIMAIRSLRLKGLAR